MIGDTVEEVKDTVEDTVEEVKDRLNRPRRKLQILIHIWVQMMRGKIENEAGRKDPMNPEDIAKHEPTAVKRDKNQGSSGDPV